MAEIKCDIVESLGVLSTSPAGWMKELNLISWNGAAPKYDIRDWAPEHEKMGNGITLSEEEAKKLPNITPHVCRHTFCSKMARKAMNPKNLQYIMGHSEYSVTMDTYTALGFDDALEDFRKVLGIEEAKTRAKTRALR